MKKLMIAAAVACAVAGIQAATVTWSDKAATGTGGALYGVDKTTELTTWAAGTGRSITDVILMNTDDISQSEFLTALRTGKYNESDFAFGDKKLDSVAANNKGVPSKVTGELPSLAATSVDLYYAILAKDADGTTSVLISTLKENIAIPSAEEATATAAWSKAGHTFSAQNYGDAAFGSAGWYTVASVPEPTSGLLLLLGVAGLALRRRRA